MKAALGSLISPFNVLSLLVSISRDALSGEENSQWPMPNNVPGRQGILQEQGVFPPTPLPNIGSHNNMLHWIQRCQTECWLGRLATCTCRKSALKREATVK